ncbi:hypothetical protein MPH_14191, partial [Macrophomina phaseolina MS6]
LLALVYWSYIRRSCSSILF